MRMRHRDLKQMMGCVQCNLCAVHGTVMCLGLGATLQVLVGSDGRGGDPLQLDRVQVAALVATAAKFGTAVETVERFRELDEAAGGHANGHANGLGGGEAAQQQANHDSDRAETFAEYLAKRASGAYGGESYDGER